MKILKQLVKTVRSYVETNHNLVLKHHKHALKLEAKLLPESITGKTTVDVGRHNNTAQVQVNILLQHKTQLTSHRIGRKVAVFDILPLETRTSTQSTNVSLRQGMTNNRLAFQST